MDDSLLHRSALHAALGEPVRLGIVDALRSSDRSPKELGERFALSTNLLSHHLDVLESVGLIVRVTSSGDHRRRYVQLITSALAGVEVTSAPLPQRVMFVCTHNSARSQLAASMWTARTGGFATSAGTHPAERVHPGAVAAAERAGLSLAGATPQLLGSDSADTTAFDLVVTVCDQAHEELTPASDWWHWSTPDPVVDATPEAFDAAIRSLDNRIPTMQGENNG